MNASIKDIAYALPETILTNDQLAGENPDWDMERVEKRTGVRRRHIAEPAETSLDLGLQASEKLFEARPELRERIDAIIFCTESADYTIPPNSCVLHGQLALPEHVLAFDVDLGCSGYPYCLGLARGLVVSGMAANLLLINADTYSKFMHQSDQSVRVLFGDGAAASWITGSDDGEGIVDIQCGTAGRYYDTFIIPAGGCRCPRPDLDPNAEDDSAQETKPPDKIHMDGAAILAFTNTKIPANIRSLLQRNGMAVGDVDLFVFHQASQMVLDSLSRLLRIKPEQMFSNLAEVGNAVSASIPITLKDAVEAGRLAPGDVVLLCGFGLGLSWGSVLLKWS